MQSKPHLVAAAAALVLGVATGAAQAQSAGSWLISGGVTQLSPNDSSGTLSAPSVPGARVAVGSDTRPTFQVTRMVTDQWAVSVPLGLGFRHKITGDGSIGGVGQIGSAEMMPLSVFGQYRFLEPSARLRPYAMLGMTYARFHSEQGSAALNGLNPLNPAGGSTGLSVDSKLALSPGLGVMLAVNERWFVDVQYVRTFLSTKASLSTGQSVNVKLNPDAISVGVGMRF